MSHLPLVGLLLAISAVLAQDETPGEAPADEPTGGPADGEEDDDGDDAEGEGGSPPDGMPFVIDTREAKDPGTLSPEQARWLKPKLNLLPPNPRAQTDFTAYTLEWGELKLGLNTIQIGILPNVQVGSSVPLDLLRLPNADLKLDFARIGPLDVAATSSGYLLQREGFSASYVTAGGMMSLEILEAWSLHGGASYGWIASDGFPDLSDISHWITGADQLDEIPGLSDASLRASLLHVQAATDVRFSRRDSIVLQVASTPWAVVATEPMPDQIPPIFGLDELLALDGRVPFTSSYTASLAYQVQWKHAQLRVGVGHSSTPAAWLTQCLDFSWRFFGTTRLNEYRQRRAWRRNQRAVEEGNLDGEPPVPEE